MLVCMRTTINLPDALGEAAKKRAKAEGRTFTSLVEEGLRKILAVEAQQTDRRPLPVSQVRGGRIVIDIDDKDALWEALDADGVK